MAAIISLSKQPSPVPTNAGIATTTYTVPAGKYAKVKMDCLLPVLNGTDLTTVVNFPANSITAATYLNINLKNVHKVYFTLTTPSSTTASCDFYINENASDIYSIKSPFVASLRNTVFLTIPITLTKAVIQKFDTLNYIYCISSTSASASIDITYLEENLKQLTLKAGDVLTFNSGKIYYEEYSV